MQGATFRALVLTRPWMLVRTLEVWILLILEAFGGMGGW